MTDHTPGLAAVDATALTPLVRAALRRDDASVVTWRHDRFGHSLHEVYGAAPTIFRFSGTARISGGELPWSLILKIVTTPGTPADPASPANGDREPMAYRTGWLERIHGVRAPRCHGVDARPGGAWLWLEDVVDDIGRAWPRDRYLLAARHLGCFNGTPEPRRDRWLSRSPLRDAARAFVPGVARLRDARDHPLAARAIDADTAARLLAMTGRIDAWLAALDRLPQGLCHWDAHRANLISSTRDDGRVDTVVLDWAGLGWGPFGADLSKFLSQSVHFFGLEPGALPALDADLFARYVDGLRDGGWHGDVRAVRFAYAAASAVRLIVRTSTALDLAFDERKRQAFERVAGRPFADLAAEFSATLPYYLSLAEEAGSLEDAG